MNRLPYRCLALLMALVSLPAHGQAPAAAEEQQPPHDISKVDRAPDGGAIAVPLPERYRRRLRKYEIPELAGTRQAVGSQLIDGELPKPKLDYRVRTDKVDQRLSFFEGGLVVLRMSGAGGVIQKRVILPDAAVEKYLRNIGERDLAELQGVSMTPPDSTRMASLRIYAPGRIIERTFDPGSAPPKVLQDWTGPLEDLLRALSEDRTVTSTVAGYEPKVGDRLVADDSKIYRVERIIEDGQLVQLRCTTQPTVMYVAKKDLYNYFVGRAAD